MNKNNHIYFNSKPIDLPRLVAIPPGVDSPSGEGFSIGEKKCSKCGIVKPFTEYYIEKKVKSGYRSACKKCYDDYALLWRKSHEKKYKYPYKQNNKKRNPDKFRAAVKKWRSKNKEKVLEMKRKHRRKRYKTSPSK